MVYLRWCQMKVKRKTLILDIVILTSFALVIAFAWFLFHKKQEPLPLKNLKQENIQVGNQIFHVWIASTPREQTRGLMFLEHLPKHDGMLFVWNHYVIEPFWMKNTLIPLTILFIKDGRVIKQMNMKPCHTIVCPLYNPNAKYNMALEINQTSQNYMEQSAKIVSNNNIDKNKNM